MLARVCGDGSRSYAGDGGPAIDALLDLPVSTVVDEMGRMYITDQANNRIRRIELDGTIRTIAGTGVPGYSGDGGPADQAQIRLPSGQSAPPVGRLAFAPNGDLFLADYRNDRIRRIRPDGAGHVIDTVAGNGTYGYSGDGGPATSASLRGPADVAVDADGNLYIADTFNACIRRVDADGIITTFAGTPEQHGFGGDGGPPGEALLDRPYGIAFNAAGDLFIADTHNQRIRVIRR
jgi:DNA-binding beta-propeller fold protein YncE